MLNRDVACMLRELVTHARLPPPPVLPTPSPEAFAATSYPPSASTASSSASSAAPAPALLPVHQVVLLEPPSFAARPDEPPATGQRMQVAIWSPPTPRWNAWAGVNIDDGLPFSDVWIFKLVHVPRRASTIQYIVFFMHAFFFLFDAASYEMLLTTFT